MGRDIKSSKVFGKEVQKTVMADLPSSDRSDARWMFQNWKSVLEWIEATMGRTSNDPFHDLSQMNHSHPSAIRRQVKAWLETVAEQGSVGKDLARSAQIAFEEAWRHSSTSITLSKPTINLEEGIEYFVKAYDPFSCTTRGHYQFSWSEVADVIRKPGDIGWLNEDIWVSIVETGEHQGGGELVVDDDGRVHFHDDLND